MPSSLTSGNRLFSFTWTAPTAAYATDFVVFTAPFDCVLNSVTEVHATAGTDGSAVSLQVTKDTGTTAPGAGTDLLANNSNVGFNLKGTINTVQYGSFKAGASRKLVRGDRLALDFAGTQTAVAGLSLTFTLNRLD
jgi:hypothetical protein